MSESDKPFTVKDRRHFTPEGDVRDEPEAAARPEAPTEPPAPPPKPEDGAESPPPDPREASPSAASTSSAPRPENRGADDTGPADFGQFLLSLGAQAGMLLSGQGLPEGADAGDALAGARSIISIIEMLREKTEGRRTSQEDEILEGLLYELRMAYVERSRTGGS